MKRRKLNYPAIPILGIGFSRGADVIGFLIALVRGGWEAAFDLDFPTHAFLITEDHKQKFTTEETVSGLQEDSLEQYTYPKNKIVAMYYWKGWDEINVAENTLQQEMDEHRKSNGASGYSGYEGYSGYPNYISKKEKAQEFLARIRRLHRDNSKYDFIGLLSFLPIIGKYFKPSKEREWCSENVATVHKKFGASFITDTKIAPDQLLCIVSSYSRSIRIENYYKE
jgi:hypothetical protein